MSKVSTRSTRQTPVSRRRLESLWENIVAKSGISVSEESEVTDEGLEKYRIQRIQFDFEKLDNEGTNLSFEPPVLFLPISPEVFNSHPIDQAEIEDQMEFRDYDPPANADKSELQDGYWTPEDCATEVSDYLWYWAVSWPRVDLLQGFTMMYNMDRISDPHPILRGPGLKCLLDTKHHKTWETHAMLEHPKENGGSVHPHVNFMTVQSCNGKDGSMLFGELAPIITVMRNRAIQPRVDEDGEEFSPQQLEFGKEERFPVIMISLLGPQHGRLFYACMDDEILVIRQSKLYSFEKFAEAPWDFFSRVLLSLPLQEERTTMKENSRPTKKAKLSED